MVKQWTPAAGTSHVLGGHTVDTAALARLADAGVLAALIDACDAPEVPARVLERGDAAGACLYRGQEALTFRERAPYLVRVDGAVLAWIEATLVGTPWGLFTVSDAPFEAQLRHWRTWLTVTSPSGEAWTFRFYDARLAPLFLANCSAAEVAAFFGPVRSLVLPEGSLAGANCGASGRMVSPDIAVGAVRHQAAHRAVGERFQLRDAHLAAFQRRSFGDALVASVVRESAVNGQHAWRDPADPITGDVLVGRPGNGAPPLRFGFDERGFVGAVTSPLGRTWQITSDAQGHPLRLFMPSGLALAFERDAAGEIARVTRSLPFSPSGRTEPIVQSAAPTHGLPRAGTREVLRAEHDAVGRPTAFAYPDGTSATLEYADVGDRAGRDMLGVRPAVAVDRLGRTTRYTYDADGDLTAVTDALGRATTFRYGAWHRPDALVHPDGRVERYAYDCQGRLAALTSADGVVLHVSIDGAGRLTGLASVGLAPHGHPAAHIEASGPVPGAPPYTTCASGVTGVDIDFTHDNAGRVVAARTGGATPTATAVVYDDAGRLVTETHHVGTDGPPLTVGYTYAASGVLSGVVGPGGERVAYEMDADGRLAALVDWEGRRYALTHVASDAGWRLVTPTGVALEVAQDAVGLAVAATVRTSDGSVICHTAWGYDAEDRLAAVDDARLGTWRYTYDAEGQLLACDGPTVAERARYAYDAAGNRVHVREGALVDDRSDSSAPATTCDVNAGNQLLRQGGLRVAYDLAGRVTSAADDVPWTYAYDARGQIVTAARPEVGGGTRCLTFGYDAFGRRVEKLARRVPPAGARPDAGFRAAPARAVVEATRTRFVWAGEQCVREVTERAAWPVDTVTVPGRAGGGGVPAGLAVAWQLVEARDYLYWPGTVTPVLVRVTAAAVGGDVPTSATYLYHTDPSGTPVRLTDDAGRVVWEAAYAPFGVVRETVTAMTQPWRRPGQYADAETGLYYNRLRYYDPRLGRYLTPDPLGLLGGSHAYRYADNAPTWNADQLGLWPTWGTIGRVAATAAVSVVVAVAVAAVVVALAPIVAAGAAATTVAGVALLAAGAAGGAAGMALNEAFASNFTCLACLGMPALKGAAIGAIAMVPLLFVPAGLTGVAALAAVGAANAASGALGYVAGWVADGAHPNQWSWGWFAASGGIAAVVGSAGVRYAQVRRAAATQQREKVTSRAQIATSATEAPTTGKTPHDTPAEGAVGATSVSGAPSTASLPHPKVASSEALPAESVIPPPRDVKDFEYLPDRENRGQLGEGWLQPTGAVRNKYAQRKISGPFNAMEKNIVHAAHLITRMFGGSGEAKNLVPLPTGFNIRPIAAFEQKLRGDYAGRLPYLQVYAEYIGTQRIPAKVTYRVFERGPTGSLQMVDEKVFVILH